MQVPRLAVAAIALVAAAAFAILDPLGVVEGAGRWLAVAAPADGTVPEIAATIRARSGRIQRLAGLLDRDPVLSAALLTAGLGAGVVAGGVGGYLHQRRLLRRGESDG